MNAVRCEICDATAATRLFVKRGYDIVRCGRCSHVFVRLDGTDEALYAQYAEGFFNGGAYLDYVGDQCVARRNFARYIAILRRYQPAGSLLEIGCTYGYFLDTARKDWDVAGIDIHEAGIAHARDRLGLHVTYGDFLNVPVDAASCDVVAMWDTIEHLRHPDAYVQKVARVLRPGGVLALTTGDVGSLVARIRGRAWRLYDPPFHLHYFSRSTMTSLLKRAGLEIVEARTAGYHRSLGFILHRVFVYNKPRPLNLVCNVARRVGAANLALYLDLRDIMFVVARKPGS